MKALLYCVKSKPDLVDMRKDYKEGYSENPFNTFDTNERGSCGYTLNGEIVASCDIDKVEEIDNGYRFEEWGRYYVTNDMSFGMLLEKSCLTDKELEKYLQEDIGYALHLTNLKVFDKPKELSEYYLFDPEHYIFKDIKKAPQNMCRVVKQPELMWATPKEQYILISIQPQHLCNILNGKKTIEVRRKILNCLKEMCKYDN